MGLSANLLRRGPLDWFRQTQPQFGVMLAIKKSVFMGHNRATQVIDVYSITNHCYRYIMHQRSKQENNPYTLAVISTSKKDKNKSRSRPHKYGLNRLLIWLGCRDSNPN